MSTISVAVQGDLGGAIRPAIERVLDASGAAIAADPADATVVLLIGDADAVRAYITEHEGATVVAVADAPDRRATAAILEAGAAGAVPGDVSGHELATALQAVVAGFFVTPRSNLSSAQHPVLTARQQQIVSLLVLGLNNGTIAQRLFVTESTVKTHLTTIFGKLGVRSRKEAIDLVLDPSSSLGRGILGIRVEAQTEAPGGYEPPTVRS